MYVGRFIVIGPDIGAYRVSSRSFPNRQVVDREGTLTVAPTADAEPTDNPYVSYNCLRIADDTAVVGNGSHVDPITEKVARGYPARDALCEALLAMDYEKDSYNTPRIAGTVGEKSYIGTVRSDALIVKEVTEPTLVATYESDTPEAYPLNTKAATEAAKAVYDADLEHAVCAAAVSRTENGFETAIENGN